MEIINKIAFLIHEPTMYAHYSSVWEAMDKDSFAIVFLDEFQSRLRGGADAERAFVTKIDAQGYEYSFFSDLLGEQVKYKYALSNHSMGGSSLYPSSKLINCLKFMAKLILNSSRPLLGKEKYIFSKKDFRQYLPLQIGIKQIRFMYGADISDGWSLQDWNEMYDLFMCHGPNDETQVKKKFKGKTALMGYPRYDGYFSPDLCTDAVVNEFAIDSTKKTILWMPTFDMFGDGVCSIPTFAKALSGLMTDYNVIVRPHPLSFRLDPDGIELLRSLNYQIDSEATRDMNSLYRVVDVVFCDHGGSAFGALYLGKKLVFLNTTNHELSVVGKNASNQELMECFPVIDVEETPTLGALLDNETLWQELMERARPLFDKFFVDYRGNSSEKAAEILSHLDLLLSEQSKQENTNDK